ncbi:hypothetical protein FisN_31Hh072 [Fistulifera solaris]|uniref:NmrA-like domain-containing protein n=1 Tax=Fistulifera solaris TaxID=1519565 RepID=A0A1Z5JA41_FISSO|nr:hypothetical protein FisN_31Hh072 [Fistulifera solaris]|eukprot:GAX10864.1 hypothetical protein FisN_31Hh072 [Fistulifera solaris]
MKTLLLFLLYWNLSEALSPRTVAVIGPTGRLGRQIVQELSTQGISTRCLLRHEIPASTSIKSLEEAQSSAEIAAYLQSLPNVTFVKGDLSDVSSLRRLLEGCDACAWNYEGEQLLRSSGMDYIIIRPGVMKDSVEENTRYGLRDNGEDMKVTSVSYHQIAALAIQSLEYSNCRRATLTAMNDADGGETSYAPLLARVQPDRRVFPVSLLEEHRKAARVGGLTIVTVLVWMAQATVKVVLHLVGSF